MAEAHRECVTEHRHQELATMETVGMTEIKSLSGTAAAEIFSSGLDNLDQIDAVAVSVLRKDGRVVAGCSNTTNDRLALMVLALDEHQRRAVRQD